MPKLHRSKENSCLLDNQRTTVPWSLVLDSRNGRQELRSVEAGHRVFRYNGNELPSDNSRSNHESKIRVVGICRGLNDTGVAPTSQKQIDNRQCCGVVN